MLFEVTVMKFDTNELLNAHAILGPISFALFIVIVVFVCLSMFLSIIMDNFRRVRDENQNQNEEILSYILRRFLGWAGMNTFFLTFRIR